MKIVTLMLLHKGQQEVKGNHKGLPLRGNNSCGIFILGHEEPVRHEDVNVALFLI